MQYPSRLQFFPKGSYVSNESVLATKGAGVVVETWSWPDSPWKRIHIDCFRPFLGQTFLIVEDAYSKWIGALPTGNSSFALTTIRNQRRLFSTFGIPEMIASDNGASFTGQEFKNFTEGNGIRHLNTAPYHAASNGLAERAVETVKNGLLKQPGKDPALKLCQFLLTYRSTPCETTGVSPAELIFKRPIRTRSDLLRPSTAEQVLAKQQAMKERYDGSTRDRTFAPEDKVYTKLGFEKVSSRHS